MFLKSSQWIMKWWYHWKPFYTGFTWYVGPTSHKSSGAVIWLVGVGPTHLPRLSLQSHVTWDPRPTSSRVGPTSHESSGAVIWLVGVGPTHHHTSHESFDVVTWRVGPTHRPTRAGGSLYNWWKCRLRKTIYLFLDICCEIKIVTIIFSRCFGPSLFAFNKLTLKGFETLKKPSFCYHQIFVNLLN